jgi:iron complex outermembrane recepter protein
MRQNYFVAAFVVLVSLMAGAVGSARAAAENLEYVTHRFDIPAEDLSSALKALGAVANIQVLFSEDVVAGLRSGPLKGDYTTDAALRILLDDSGLKVDRSVTGVLLIRRSPAKGQGAGAATVDATTDASPTAAAPGEPLVAQAAPGAAADQATAPQAAAKDASTDQVQEVTVTGSRIARPDFVSDYPIVSSSAADLQASAKINVETALEQMPQFLNGQDENYDAGAVGGGGRATLNLRGLGQQRTLVLLDGRRLPPTDGTGVADINDIPLSIVDNIQVISGGASAAYGSDAMAGVVNIITKTTNGVELTASEGMDEGGIGKRHDFSLNAGGTFADGKGHAMIALDYTERDAIPGSAIPFFVFGGQSTNTPYGFYSPTTSPTGFGADPPSQAAINAYFGQYGAAAGTVGNTTPLGFNNNGTLFSSRSPFTNYTGVPIGTGGFENVGGSLIIEIGQYTFVTVPQNRYSAFSKESYDLSDHVQLYFQLLANHDTVSTQNTYFPVNASALTTVPVTNPFIPADLLTLLDSRANPTEPFSFSKRFVDFPPSRWNEYFDTDQFLTGAKGDVPGFGLDWNVYYMRDYSLDTEVQNGVIDQQRYQELLNAPGGGTGLCAGGFNPFQGFTSNVSPQCYSFMTVDTHTTTLENQDTVEGDLGGKIIDLPAGAARFDINADWRRWTSSYSPDSLLVLGNPPTDSGGGFNPTSGAIRVAEIGGEVLIPLLKDKFLAQSLNLNLAYRFSDYDLSGGANTYKFATDWRPVQSVLIRGGFEHAIRAPDINDLFQTATQSTVQVGNVPLAGDPCDYRSAERTGPNGAKVAALCAAQGIPASEIANYTYAYTSAPIVTSGSLDVKPEKADTVTIGGVITPDIAMPAFEHMQLSLDYFHIRIADAIGTSGYQTVIQNCYNLDGANPTYSATNPSCELINRNFGGTPGGSFLIGQPTMNLGGLLTSGIDAELDWAWRLSDLGLGAHAGQLHLNSTLSWTNHFEIQQLPGQPWYDYGGTISLPLSATPSVPTWRALTTLNYTFEPIPVTLGLRWRYIDAMADQSVVLVPSSTVPGVPAYNYLDLVAKWNITEHVDVSATIANLLQRIPPEVDATPGETQLGLYDIGPRTYLLTVHAKL